MSQFATLIREIAEQLDVPQPARSRILLEVAADLEDMCAHYKGQGLSPEEAAARAEKTLALSGQALDGLVRIHQPPLRRLLDQLSVQAQTTWERVVLVLVALCVGVLAVREVLATSAAMPISQFVWPLAAIASVALLVALVRVYALYLKQDHDPRRVRRGLDALVFLAITSLVVGLQGLVVELYLTARRAVAGAEIAQPVVPELLVRTSAMMTFSLTLAIAIGVVWFALLSTAQRIERAEAEALLVGPESREPPSEARESQLPDAARLEPTGAKG